MVHVEDVPEEEGNVLPDVPRWNEVGVTLVHDDHFASVLGYPEKVAWPLPA